MGKLEKTTCDFAAHAVSGLCTLIPDLSWECHQLPLWRVTIDLLAEEPLPLTLHKSQQLSQIVVALRAKFFAILTKHSPHLGRTVSKLTISVEFPASTPVELHHLKKVGGYYFHAPRLTERSA
jgi:hypothetical protein